MEDEPSFRICPIRRGFDHDKLTHNGRVPMLYGKIIVMDNSVGRLRSLFPSCQLDMIVGSLLGDASLECRSNGKRGSITARFRAHHGDKQKEYIFWKYSILQDLTSREPRKIVWENPKRSLREVSWYFHTKSLEELGVFYELFYPNKKKILPENVFQLLTPRSLAIWFMDDGTHTGAGMIINSHSFSKKEQEKIRHFFESRYGIITDIVKDREKWKIIIKNKNKDTFIHIIKPFLIPTMKYKIVYPRNDSL